MRPRVPYGVFLLLFLLLLPTIARSAQADALVTLTNAAGVHELGQERAEQAYPVRLTGTVTYSDPLWGVLFVQDESGGAFAALSGGAYPKQGEKVEIVGHTAKGSFLPVVSRASWRSLGLGSLPAPRQAERPDLFASELDCEWSELTGVVKRVVPLDRPHHIQIDVRDGVREVRLFVQTSAPEHLARASAWVDARIRALGVAGIDRDEVKDIVQLKLFVSDLGNIRVLTPPPADPFSSPFLALAKLRALSGTNVPTHRVRVRGTITYLPAPNELLIQEDSAAIRVLTPSPHGFQQGDSLEAVGFYQPEGFSGKVEEALLRKAVVSAKADPVPVPATQVLWGGFDACLLRVSGTLQHVRHTQTNHTLTLLQDGILFGVLLQGTNAPDAWSTLQTGDLLSAAGICAILGERREAPQSFQIIARSEADVSLITRTHVFSGKQVLLLAAVAAAGCGLVFLWGFALRRKVREQTAVIQARAEKELALHRRYRELLENAPFPVVVFRQEPHAVLYANQRAIARLSSQPNGTLPTSLADVCLSQEKLQGLLFHLRQTGPISELEMEFRTLQGDRFPALVCANSIEFDQQAAVLLSFNDITQRKKAEETVRLSEKMESIGHLAGGMAHEFNNILAALMLNLSLIDARNQDLSSTELLKDATSLAHRAADLIRMLLAFSRRSILQLQPMNWADCVRHQRPSLERILGDRIAFSIVEPKDATWVMADRSLLERTLLNLTQNARDAMPEGGSFQLTFSVCKSPPTQLTSANSSASGKYVCLSVKDTGRGMTEETKKHLFEPFFTTKEVGKGPGLGLATVRGMILQQQGRVEVESTPGQGTLFRICLPAIPTPTIPPAAASHSP